MYFTSDKPHYENEPFEVPSSWVWTTLGDIFTLQAGKNITSKDIHTEKSEEHKYSCFGGNGVRGYVSISNKTGEYPIIGRQGALCGNVNLACGSFYATEHAVVVERYCDTDLMWAFYTLIALNLNQYATATAQPGLAVNVINNVAIPLPPLYEQQRISKSIKILFSFLETIECEKLNLKTAISQTKAKVLDLAIHGKLVPQDPADEPASELLKRINPKAEITSDNGHYQKLPFKIPKSWVWCGHNNVLEISGGSQPAKNLFISVPKANYIRLYQIRDYGENPIPVYIPEELASKRTEKGDILLARYGGSLGKVFHAERGAYNVAMAKVIFKYPNVIFKDFAYYYYLSDLYQGRLKEISRTAQAGFNSSDFNEMLFPLPPYEEQKRIVNAINKTFTILDRIMEYL